MSTGSNGVCIVFCILLFRDIVLATELGHRDLRVPRSQIPGTHVRVRHED